MNAKLYVAAFIILVSNMAVSAVTCVCNDTSFNNFIDKFENDLSFQRIRIIFPLVYRFGDYRLYNPEVKLLSLKDIETLGYPLIYSKQQLEKNHMGQSIIIKTERYSELYQEILGESDSVRVLYSFRMVGGCWFLEDVHDKSL